MEIIRLFGQIYDEIMKRRRNEDYEINPEQMDRFLEAVSFFQRKAQELDGTIDPFGFEPKEEHGGLTASFIVFDLTGEEETKEFSRIVSYCSALSIDTKTDSTCVISMTIPNIYRPRRSSQWGGSNGFEKRTESFPFDDFGSLPNNPDREEDK